jgi:hypothetical protein
VPVAQPAGRLVRNLLEPHVAQPEAFVKEQERRRAKRLGDQIYDTTAWSLALAFDVEALASAATLTARTSAFTGELAARATTLPDATVGYLLPWGSATANVVIEALQAGLSVRRPGLHPRRSCVRAWHGDRARHRQRRQPGVDAGGHRGATRR